MHTLYSKVFQSMLKRALLFAGTDKTRPVLWSVLLELAPGTVNVVATDTHRIIKLSNAATGEGTASIVLSYLDVKKLIPTLRKGITSIEIADNVCTVNGIAIEGVLVDEEIPGTRKDTSDRYGKSYTCEYRKAHATYPNNTRVYPDFNEVHATINTAELLAICAANKHMPDKTNRIIFTFKEGILTLETRNEFNELGVVGTVAATHTEEYQIAFNNRYVIDALTVVQSDTTTFTFRTMIQPYTHGNLKPCRITQDDVDLVLMPMQIV